MKVTSIKRINALKVTSITRTRDPITYSAKATINVEMLSGLKTFVSCHNGDENESRREVKAEAAKLVAIQACDWGRNHR